MARTTSPQTPPAGIRTRLASTVLLKAGTTDVVLGTLAIMAVFRDDDSREILSGQLVISLELKQDLAPVPVWPTLIVKWNPNGYELISSFDGAVYGNFHSATHLSYCPCKDCDKRFSKAIGDFVGDETFGLEAVLNILEQLAQDKMTSLTQIVKNLTTPSVN